jgi:hypothetical protein
MTASVIWFSEGNCLEQLSLVNFPSHSKSAIPLLQIPPLGGLSWFMLFSRANFATKESATPAHLQTRSRAIAWKFIDPARLHAAASNERSSDGVVMHDYYGDATGADVVQCSSTILLNHQVTLARFSLIPLVSLRSWTNAGESNASVLHRVSRPRNGRRHRTR